MLKKAFHVVLRRVTSRAFWFVALFLILLISKDFLIARSLEAVAKGAGAPLAIEHFHINLSNGQVWAKDIRIQSPKGFEDEPMIHIDFLFVNLGVSTFFRPGIHLENLVLQLSEIRFVRNADGEMNLALLKLEGFPLRLDQFEILIDRIVYKDLGAPVSDLERVLEVSIREKHMDVADLNNLNGLIRLIVLKAARNAAFARLLNLNPADLLKDNVFVLLTGARGVGKAAAAVTSVVTKPFESAPEEKLESAVEKAEKGVEEIEQATLEKLEITEAVNEKTKEREALERAVEERAEEAEKIRAQTEEAAMILDAKKEAVKDLGGEIHEMEKTSGVEENLDAQKMGLEQIKKEVEAEEAAVKEAEERAATAENAVKEEEKKLQEVEKELEGKTEALKKTEEVLKETQEAVEEKGAEIEALREEVKA